MKNPILKRKNRFEKRKTKYIIKNLLKNNKSIKNSKIS
jgi:hypothetical protein